MHSTNESINLVVETSGRHSQSTGEKRDEHCQYICDKHIMHANGNAFSFAEM